MAKVKADDTVTEPVDDDEVADLIEVDPDAPAVVNGDGDDATSRPPQDIKDTRVINPANPPLDLTEGQGNLYPPSQSFLDKQVEEAQASLDAAITAVTAAEDVLYAAQEAAAS